MKSSEHEHLDAAQLAPFLECRLSPQAEQAFVAHLDSCDVCRQWLESAAGNRDWWEAAKDLSQHGGCGRDGVGETTATPAGDDRIERQLRHILTPSDDPRMIGRIGNYEIAGVIGRGATGIVVKAFDPSLRRFVAVKALAPELSIAGAARERFAREARAAAAVTHENVIPIYAVSEFRGHDYIVMQYVPGQSLEQRIRARGSLGVVATLRIAMQIARALAAAHEQGLVHRDIKPANILLEEGIDRPVVTDFGLARVADDASLTVSGVVTGTPNYMSPEQACGQPVDARSDLFSLGSVMYAMCVGHPPFRSETIVGVLRRVADGQPSPIRGRNPAVHDWLEAFVLKLLAKHPHRRFDTASQVAELLADELAHLQNPTAHKTPRRDWWDKPQTAFGGRRVVGLIAAMAVAAGVGVVAISMPGEVDAPGEDSPREEIERPQSKAATQGAMDATADISPNADAAAGSAAEARDWDASLRQTVEDSLDIERNWRKPNAAAVFDPWTERAAAAEAGIGQIENEESGSTRRIPENDANSHKGTTNDR